MKKLELVIAGGGLTAARAIISYRESVGGGVEALLKDLIAEHPPMDTLERELVGGRSR